MPRLLSLAILAAMLIGATGASGSDFDFPWTAPRNTGANGLTDLIYNPGIVQWNLTPYQRNAMIGFDTDPFTTWPAPSQEDVVVNDPILTDAWDLTPPNYDLQGWDDPSLYPTDWFGIYDPDSAVRWSAVDPFHGSALHTGVLFAENDYVAQINPSLDPTNSAIEMADNTISFSMFWHIDNWSGGWSKEFFDEIWYYTSGPMDVFDISLIASDGQVVDLFDNIVRLGFDNRESLPHSWLYVNQYAQIRPNPSWEILKLDVSLAPLAYGQGASNNAKFAIDSMHVATECPEPGTFALFGLGTLGIVVWRRRKSA